MGIDEPEARHALPKIRLFSNPQRVQKRRSAYGAAERGGRKYAAQERPLPRTERIECQQAQSYDHRLPEKTVYIKRSTRCSAKQ